MNDESKRLMFIKRYQRFLANLIFVVVSLVVFVAGGECAAKIGELKNSGILGICGPYGDHADLVGSIFLASFPVAVFTGVAASKIFKDLVADQSRI